MGPVYEMKGLSQTRFFRKPDVCPVSEAKFRKPVLAGLRSNNEMNIFGFRSKIVLFVVNRLLMKMSTNRDAILNKSESRSVGVMYSIIYNI